MKAHILFLLLSLFFVTAYGQQHKIDSLKNGLKIAKEDTNKVNTLNRLSYRLEAMSQYDSSIAYANKAKLLAEKLSFKKGIANALANSGDVYFNRGDFSKARDNALAALAINQEIGNRKGISDNYSLIGTAFAQLSDYPKAREYLLKALAIEQELKDTLQCTRQFVNIAGIYYYQANYSDALDYTFKALSLAQKINNKQQILHCVTNLGEIYYNQGNYPKALEYFTNGLEMSQKTGNKNLIAHNLCNIGIVYENEGNYTNAAENYSRALALFTELGSKIGISLCLTNMASADVKQGNYSAATVNNGKSLTIAKEIGSKKTLITCYASLGSIYTKKKNYKLAKKYLDSSLALSKDNGEIEHIETAYSKLFQLDSSIGDYKTALKDYELYFMFRDSIINEKNTKKTVQAEMNYEFEQKQATQQAEEDKKELIRSAEQSEHKTESRIQRILIGLIAAVAVMLMLIVIVVFQRMKGVEKERRISEQQKSWLELKALRTQMNPHFLYNTINSIQSFVLKNDTQSSSNYLAQFAVLMRGVLENSRKDKITLEEEITGLVNYLDFEAMRFPDKFNYRIKTDEGLDKSRILLPPLLIQPYLENAIWHGFMHMEGNNGQLLVMFEKVDNHIKCIIDDNGIGRKAATEMKKKSIHKSVGLSIVAERMESMNKMYQWDMKMEIMDKMNGDGTSAGTRVELFFPLILNTVEYA